MCAELIHFEGCFAHEIISTRSELRGSQPDPTFTSGAITAIYVLLHVQLTMYLAKSDTHIALELSLFTLGGEGDPDE